jgi:hypothetical protein
LEIPERLNSEVYVTTFEVVKGIGAARERFTMSKLLA